MPITPKRLSAVLQQILILSVASAGCGGVAMDDVEPIPCGSSGKPDYLTGLALAEPADYIEVRQRKLVINKDTEEAVLQSTGVRCATAQDGVACDAAIAAASTEGGFLLRECEGTCLSLYLVVNRGQDVAVVDSPEELRELLGPINSPAEAMLVAAGEGYRIICGDSALGSVREVSGKYEVVSSTINDSCSPDGVTRYVLEVTSDGEVTELDSQKTKSTYGCIGRRPAGLLRERARRAGPVGAFWANVAHLEAASVYAFAALRRELLHHGAPVRLLRSAARSIRDEARHAVITRRLAARYGATAPRPRVERAPVRSLEDIAVENAVEGCVRETFGALVGAWQARFARDPEVRRAMRSIARDEARHAELAWAVDAWARSKLHRAAWERVEAARAAALAELDGEILRDPSGELVKWAGLPSERAQKELAQRLRDAMQA